MNITPINMDSALSGISRGQDMLRSAARDVARANLSPVPADQPELSQSLIAVLQARQQIGAATKALSAELDILDSLLHVIA